jgi:hypothetical protein
MEIGSLLTNAFSPDTFIRQQAENSINILCENSFEETLYCLSLELTNNLASKNNRQLAGTLIRNLILGYNQFKGKYLSLNQLTREKIKCTITSCLVLNDSDLNKTAALITAGKIFLMKQYARSNCL